MRKSKYTSEFKFNLVTESIKKGNVSEVARSHGVGVNLLSKWRVDFFKKGHSVFESRPDQDVMKLQKKVGQLEQMVGKKEVELNLIKNFADFYGSQSGG